MKFIGLVALLALLASCQQVQGGGSFTFTVQGTLLQGAGQDSVKLYDWAGLEPVKLAAAKLVPQQGGEAANFTLSGTVPGPGMYMLVVNAEQYTYLAITDATPLTLTADLRDVEGSLVVANSPANTYLNSYLRRQRTLQQVQGQQQASAAFKDSIQQASKALAQEYATKPGPVSLLARLYSYHSNDLQQGKYQNEQDHFVRGFFQHDPLADANLGFIPPFQEKVRYYVSVLPQLGMLPTEAAARLDSLAQQMPAQSRTLELFYLNALQAAQQSDADLFALVAERYLKAFPNAPRNTALKETLSTLTGVGLGKPAPELTLNSPQGAPIKLSSLKGKVVLVDFWASWCRPCRAEMPNVVQAYNNYKAKGFDIYSVSLDENKDAWVKAIEADGMSWPSHVSDLGGWQSEGAKLYNVTSIPFALLVDRQGTIIAKNLRGAALEKKLSELLP